MVKFKIQQTELGALLSKVNGCCRIKNTMDVIKVEVRNNRLYLTVYNDKNVLKLDVGVQDPIEGEFLMNINTIHLISNFPGTEIDFTEEDGTVWLRTKSRATKFRMGKPTENLPNYEFQLDNMKDAIEIPEKEFRSLMGMLQGYIAPKDTRPAFNSVYFDTKNNKAVATNGHVLASAELNMTAEAMPFYINGTQYALLKQCIEASSFNILKIRTGNSAIQIIGHGYELLADRETQAYIRYEALLKKDGMPYCILEKSALVTILDYHNKYRKDERVNSVFCNVRDAMILYMEQGEFKSLDVLKMMEHTFNQEMTVCVDPAYLLYISKAIPGIWLSLYFGGELKPIILTADKYEFLLMPVKSAVSDYRKQIIQFLNEQLQDSRR